MELICPAGTPAALEAAVDAGADAIYCGFRDETNARNFPGLNFSREEMREGIAYAHKANAKVLVAINTFPRAGALELWHRAVDDARDNHMETVRTKINRRNLLRPGCFAFYWHRLVRLFK